MCKAKSEGGKRCERHLRAELVQREDLVAKWEEEVEKRQKAVEAEPTSRKRRDLRTAEQRVLREQEKLAAVRAEAEAVKEDNPDQEAGSSTPRRRARSFAYLSAHLSEEEWDLVASEAADHGFVRQYAGEVRPNVTAYVRQRIADLPTIGATPAATLERPTTHSTHGRHPSRNGTSRVSQTVAISGDEADRLEEEARIFGLSCSDYVRALLLRRDPRQPGAHEGYRAFRDRRDSLAGLEQGMTEAGLVPGDFYAQKVREARQRVMRAEVSSGAENTAEGHQEAERPVVSLPAGEPKGAGDTGEHVADEHEPNTEVPAMTLDEIRARREARNAVRRVMRERAGKKVMEPALLDNSVLYKRQEVA